MRDDEIPDNDWDTEVAPVVVKIKHETGRLADKRAKALTFPVRQIGRSRGLATSQITDGSPSLRRRHRAAGLEAHGPDPCTKGAGVSSLYRTAFDRRYFSANQPLFLRDGIAAMVIHKVL
jgi:hypothetical protein